MAVEFGDPTNGFYHAEVMQFINNEILMNGGGQDFYQTFRSRSWNEIEDALYNILGDQQMSHSQKRACAWSALSLAVRVVARQREQHRLWVMQLKEHLGSREAFSWALVSEFQQLHQQRDQVTAQLRFTRSALHQAQSECDILRRRLLKFEKFAQVASLAQYVMSGQRVEQFGAAAWPPRAEQQRDVWAMGEHGRLSFEPPNPAPRAACMPKSQSTWASTVPPPLPDLGLQSIPPSAPFPMGISPLLPPAPTAVTETAATVPFQTPPMRIYPRGSSATGGFQDEMACLWGKSCCGQEEVSKTLQSSVLGDNRSLSQEDELRRPWGMPVLEERAYSRKEKNPKRSLEMTLPGDVRSHNQEFSLLPQEVSFGKSWHFGQKDQDRPQRLASLGISQDLGQEEALAMKPSGSSSVHRQAEDRGRAQCVIFPAMGRSRDMEKDTGRIQAMTSTRASKRHTQGSIEKAWGMIPLEFSRMQEDVRPQYMLFPDLRIHNQEESVEKQQPQKQKPKEKQEKKATASQQEKSVLCPNPGKWVCLWCKVTNFSWRVSCYKCMRVHLPLESRDGAPEN